MTMAKALNVKNLVEEYVDSWGYESDELWDTLYWLRNHGFIDTYTLNCFSDTVAQLYCFEDERVWKDEDGKVAYKYNEATGHFDKTKKQG